MWGLIEFYQIPNLFEKNVYIQCFNKYLISFSREKYILMLRQQQMVALNWFLL